MDTKPRGSKMEYQPSSHGAHAYYLQHCAPPAKSKIATMGSQNVQQVYPYIIGLPNNFRKLFFFKHYFFEKSRQQRKKTRGKESVTRRSLPVDRLICNQLQLRPFGQNNGKIALHYHCCQSTA